MSFEELERYRENGYINIDRYLRDNPGKEVLRENRGSKEREKDWIDIHGKSSLLRTEMIKDADNVPMTYSIYAELIIEELAKQVGIECAHYDLIVYKGEYGVLSENVIENPNESMTTIQDIMISLGMRKKNDNVAMPTDVNEIFDVFKELSKYENIDKVMLQNLNLSLAKIAIFDTFTMATDRHMENLALIYSGSDNGSSVRISPIFDNECSLMLDMRKDEVDELIASHDDRLETYVELQNQLIVVPDEEKEEENLDWEDLLYYFCDNSDHCMDFAAKCYNQMDVKKAIENVESRINTKLPKNLDNFLTRAFFFRKEKIRNILGIEKSEATHEVDNFVGRY